MKKIIILMLACCAASPTQAQIFSETIRKELSFEKVSDLNALLVFNVNGDVNVVGYAGDKILIEVEKRILAKTQDRLEKGKREIQLGVLDRADTILIYIRGLCSSFGRYEQQDNWRSKYNGWGYQWEDCKNKKGCETLYDYSMNLTIKVPQSCNVVASTVNDGDVFVESLSGFVVAENINGSITLRNIANATYASTINGDVDLDYVANPTNDSRYYSLNGDIKANFKKGLAADLSFESFNGNLYTNVEQLEALPVMLEKKSTSKGMKYKIGGTHYRIGKGGIHLDFETFNGDVYVKEF